ncbi:hypothetical protein [Calidithermus roseus]|uniref:Uncharacterized protein n=1 Tax=Calidithermus roseus TaxID=1644118 RepID=A0A399ECY6_9DEIN|nr:hypothetical protein [Calidithermus roseus]RIH82504.1 hypothetical protein Mrose_03363 [Calidithermus roseus]
MKHLPSTFHWIFLPILLSVLSVSAFAQSKQMTVADYFKLLPDRYFTLLSGDATLIPHGIREDLAIASRRTGYIERTISGITYEMAIDMRNEYLMASSSQWELVFEMAVWRAKGQEPLIGLSINGCTAASCKNVTLHFLRYKNGAWVDVTDQVLPKITAQMMLEAYRTLKRSEPEATVIPRPFYEIPRVGTTIAVYMASPRVKVFNLIWRGERFDLRKAE